MAVLIIFKSSHDIDFFAVQLISLAIFLSDNRSMAFDPECLR